MRTFLTLVWSCASAMLALACGKDSDSQVFDLTELRDPLDCVVPLPPASDDGTPWPSYSEKLREFQDCRDGDQSLAGFYLVVQTDCADGKKSLSMGSGFVGATYYYQGEELVGLERGSDFIAIEPDGCNAARPMGTRASVSCNAVEERPVTDCTRRDAGG